MIEKICKSEQYNCCYFRTASDDFPKTLIQITNKCNMFCKHCFLSATETGEEMPLDSFQHFVLEFLLTNQIKKVTLTGGEPLTHPNIYEICCKLIERGIAVTICTNLFSTNKILIKKLCLLENVKFNVSMDGFSNSSIQRFRNRPDAFDLIFKNAKYISSKGKLKGILCTPNIYSNINEYIELVMFAKRTNAEYVLFNPIAALGRGALSKKSESFSTQELIKLKEKINEILNNDSSFDTCFIRFPSDQIESSVCTPNRFLYILRDGTLTKCPYILFAYQTLSKTLDNNILLGNIFREKINIRSLDFVKHKTCMAHKLLGE